MNNSTIHPGCAEQVRFNLLFKKPVEQSGSFSFIWELVWKHEIDG